MKVISALLMKKVKGFSLVESLAILLIISMVVIAFLSYGTTRKLSVQSRYQAFYSDLEKNDRIVEEELWECN